MKKFLFILFFPITVPVYLLIKLFEWIKDTFIPFVQYDVIPFVDKHIVSKIREYIDYKVEQMQEEKCAENRASNSIESGSKIKTDYLQTTANENCDVADILQEENSPVYNDNTLMSEQETIPITISVSTTVQAYSNSLVRHPPPFTPEEYKKIRYAESLEQSITLKKCFTSDLYKDYYTCGDIFNFWGARYRLLAIDRFEHCLQIHPNASLYRVLGDLYEKDHRFQDAQAMYQMYLYKMPEYPAGYVFVARCLLKQNKIDEALDFLNDAKSTEYYLNPTAESHFDTCIDDKYREYAKKKAHGYIFKPKKITVEYIEVGNMSIEDICTDYLKKWQ